jgi:predicted nucleotidyltransferase
MPFNKFLWHERRKGFQGRFMNRDFFIRYIKDWDEINEKYGDYLYEKKGYTKIKAKITDDSESIYTPCAYKVSNVEFLQGGNRSLLKEIVSFRGRFCEQAKTGETVIAQGEIEKVKNSNEIYYRIILGRTKRDFMIVSN